jgi:hypothetical protein
MMVYLLTVIEKKDKIPAFPRRKTFDCLELNNKTYQNFLTRKIRNLIVLHIISCFKKYLP